MAQPVRAGTTLDANFKLSISPTNLETLVEKYFSWVAIKVINLALMLFGRVASNLSNSLA
jgi:hypothetical protein